MRKCIPVLGAILVLAAVTPLHSLRAPHHSQTLKTEKLFLPIVLEMNAVQVELGRLAATRASDPTIKALGRMEADTHARIVESLGGFYHADASAKPSGNPEYFENLTRVHKEDVERVRGLSLSAFDREIVNLLTREHQRSIEFLELRMSDFAAKSGPQYSESDLRPDFARLCEELKGLFQEHLIRRSVIE